MRKKILAGNWKMNMLNSDLEGYFHSLEEAIKPSLSGALKKVEISFAVPFTLLHNAAKLAHPKGISIGAQNFHYEESGAYTGEISLGMLKEIDINTALIGHSERREYFNETDDSVSVKTGKSLKAGFHAISCVGETQKEREAGKTEEVIKRQVAAIIEGSRDPSNLTIAYEPVWAIGTGLAATSEQAQDIHKYIRSLLAETHGQEKANKVRILYGGSMKPQNTKELLSMPDIDGGLVGGASLKPASFAEMISIASSL